MWGHITPPLPSYATKKKQNSSCKHEEGEEKGPSAPLFGPSSFFLSPVSPFSMVHEAAEVWSLGYKGDRLENLKSLPHHLAIIPKPNLIRVHKCRHYFAFRMQECVSKRDTSPSDWYPDDIQDTKLICPAAPTGATTTERRKMNRNDLQSSRYPALIISPIC